MIFIWPESARVELRAIPRETAVRILHALTRFSESGEGDVRSLAGGFEGYSRLRLGDYRVIFRQSHDRISILRVRRRSEAYR